MQHNTHHCTYLTGENLHLDLNFAISSMANSLNFYFHKTLDFYESFHDGLYN